MHKTRSIALAFALFGLATSCAHAPGVRSTRQVASSAQKQSSPTAPSAPTSEEQLWIDHGFANASILNVDSSQFYTSDPQSPWTHQMSLTAVVLRKADWSASEVVARYQDVANIYTQCGVKLTGLKVVTVDAPNNWIYYAGMVKDLNTLLDDPNKNEAKVAKMLPISDRPVLFYVQLVKTNEAYANTAITEDEDHQNAPVINTVWISARAKDAEHKYDPHYSPEAHELGHVFADLVHLYLPQLRGSKNLMAGDIFNQSTLLTPQQCQKIRNSPLLKRLGE